MHALPSLYAAVLIVGAAAISAPAYGETPEIIPSPRNGRDAPQDSAYALLTSRGAVTLELQPRWEDGTLFIDVRADTHTVALDSMDLGARVRLIIGNDSIAPDRAGALSGHHSSTTLEFRRKRRPAEFTIEIRDVPDIALRTLTWPAGGSGGPGNDGPPVRWELTR